MVFHLLQLKYQDFHYNSQECCQRRISVLPNMGINRNTSCDRSVPFQIVHTPEPSIYIVLNLIKPSCSLNTLLYPLFFCILHQLINRLTWHTMTVYSAFNTSIADISKGGIISRLH